MKSKLSIIGLTGGIACGKSTVAELLRRQGQVVICADAIAHDVVKRGKPALRNITRLFGKKILTHNGALNRKALAQIVFSDSKKRTALEAVIHPLVRKELKTLIAIFAKKGPARIFIDVPLLFETGLNRICTKILCVTASTNTQIKRAMATRPMTKKQLMARIAAQMPVAQKAKMADHVIINDGTKKELHQQVKKTLLNITSTEKKGQARHDSNV